MPTVSHMPRNEGQSSLIARRRRDAALNKIGRAICQNREPRAMPLSPTDQTAVLREELEREGM